LASAGKSDLQGNTMSIKQTDTSFHLMRIIIELALPLLLGVLAISMVLASHRRVGANNGCFLALGRGKRHAPGQGTAVRAGVLLSQLRD